MGLSGPTTLSHHVLQVDRLPVHFARAGSGQTLLLIHGWGAEIASFGMIPSILAKRFDVVALDLPGFGQTPLPDRVWGTEDYANLVVEFMRQMNLGCVTLVGHSFGGKTSIAVSAHHPEHVKKVVLVDSAGIRPARGPDYYLRVSAVKIIRRVLGLPLLRAYREPLMRAIYSRIGSSDYSAATHPTFRATFVKVVNEDMRHLLPLIKAPTLLYWGSADPDTPLADAKLMERLIPDAGLVVVQGAGHFSYLADVDHFCRVVTHFVEN